MDGRRNELRPVKIMACPSLSTTFPSVPANCQSFMIMLGDISSSSKTLFKGPTMRTGFRILVRGIACLIKLKYSIT